MRVKIGICGLHYHPSDPFLFGGFFQRSLFPFIIYNFFIHLDIRFPNEIDWIFIAYLTRWLPLQKLSQKINGKVNLQEAGLLENGGYHCNLNFKIGHGHEERHRQVSYVVFIHKKYLYFALAL